MAFKLDIPIGKIDDWDLLQASFEAMLLAMSSQSRLNVESILQKEFPLGQSKAKQIKRLKVMLSQHNEWDADRTPMHPETPETILQETLNRINNERQLSQEKTTRELLLPIVSKSKKQSNHTDEQCYPYFCRDFWSFLKHLKANDHKLLGPLPEVIRLQPGEIRTLEALKKEFPKGLTLEELASKTEKDKSYDETATGSLSPWLSRLRQFGLVRSEKESRANRWFFVKDLNS